MGRLAHAGPVVLDPDVNDGARGNGDALVRRQHGGGASNFAASVATSTGAQLSRVPR